jgi:hypothetical protein
MQACGTTGAHAGERKEEDGRENRRERGVGKAAGDERAFIARRASGLADAASADAMPEAAGGQRVTGPLDQMA